MKKRFALYGMFAAMAIFAAACGDDSSSSASAPEDEEYSSSSEEAVSSSSAKKDGKSSSSEAKKGKSSSSEEDVSSSSAKKDGKSSSSEKAKSSSSSEAKKDDKSSSSGKATSSSSAKDGKSSSSEKAKSSSSAKDDKSSSSEKAKSSSSEPESSSSEPESSSSLPYGITCFAKRDGNVVSAEMLVKTIDDKVEILKVQYDYDNMKLLQSLPFSNMSVKSCDEARGIGAFTVIECSDETRMVESEMNLTSEDLYPEIATPADAEKNFCSEFESGYDVYTSSLNKKMLDEGKYGKFRDLRDAKLYRTIQIGDQTWIAQNLNYESESGSSCYGGENNNCYEYGRLYTWEAAQTACPDGWRLPTKADFVKLIANVDSDFDETSSSFSNGEKLRTESWYEGSNEIGFSAVAGGDYYSEKYSYQGSDAYFWSQTANGESEAYVMMVSTSGEGNNLFGGSTGTTMNSVRCIKK